MGVSIKKWDAATAASRLRNRRRLPIISAAVLGIILLSILADHLRGQNPFRDDWNSFDGRKVRIVHVIDSQSISVRDEISDEVTTVKLLGIKSSKPANEIESELIGRLVTLHLGPTRTRDESGRLLADAVLENGQLVSAELVGAGMAMADRDSSSMFLSVIERAQAQARKKHIGMWADFEMENKKPPRNRGG